MWFTAGVATALEALSLLSVVAAEAESQSGGMVVDRLISRHHPDYQHRLARRDSGYSNGGSQWNAGKDGHGHRRNASNYELSFYHINDVHAHLDEFRSSGSSCTDPSRGCVGGYSRVKTVIDKTRKTHENSLFLNAGDEFQGTLFYTVFKGDKIAETLNQLGFDGMALGNHEFDDGDDLLADFLRKLNFPVIASNICSDNRKLARELLPYKIYARHNLAVLAVTTETTPNISSPAGGTTFEDPIAAAQRTVREIRRRHRHVRRIVALTHIGYERDIELARATSGISLVIGGHSHTLLGDSPAARGRYPTIATNADGDDVFVVTAYRWGEYLGYIDVEYDARGRIVAYEGAPVHLTNATAEEPGLKAQVTGWAKAFAQYANTVLGFTQHPLVQSTCQTQECTLGSFTADAMEDFRPSERLAGAIINAGGIRSEIDGPANITLQQALECFPFGNSVAQLDFTGARLWDVFEGIVSAVSTANGRPVTSFAQVSRSIRFTYNPANPLGSRLITLAVRGSPINLARTYTISTLDFLATGGDNFWPPRTDFTPLATMDEVWAEYVRARSPIAYQLDGRIATTTETVPQKAL